VKEGVVLPATHKNHICLYSVHIHQMAPPESMLQTSNYSLLLNYRPRKDKRLSWPGWLTCSRWFTHTSVTHQVQVECKTGKVRRRKTGALPLCHATNCQN